MPADDVVDPYFFNSKLVKRTEYTIKCWTLTYGQLNNFYRVLFSTRMELHPTSRAPFVPPGMKYCLIMDCKEWSSRLASKTTRRNPKNFFLWKFVNDKVYSTFVHNSTQFKQVIMTGIRTVMLEAFNNVEVNYENRLHAVI